MKYFNNRPFIKSIRYGNNQSENLNKNSFWKYFAYTALGVYIGYTITKIYIKRKNQALSKNDLNISDIKNQPEVERTGK
jgi:hypothetical protein